MEKIQLLDIHTINKIAAGEVVERPSSVVKELIENSIDAKASAITIEIKEGGTSFIRVTDNGSGIPKDQVKTAFLRHATNKIQAVEDLEEVLSLGFRGEALASIAAVSQLEMITKTGKEMTGVFIEIQGGKVIRFQDAGCSDGTSIIVKNLFYNVPARKKFLKKPGTESGYISDLINKIALGHPEISFKYINHGSVLLHTSGNHDLKTAVFHVYGKEIVKKMIPLQAEEKGYQLKGLIGKPELSRANRSYENFFINGRFVKSELVLSAIEDAYKTRLMTGKFPIYALNLEISPSAVDVNVHPTKLEVRFADEEGIYQFLFRAVSNVLKEQILIPELNWESKNSLPVKEMMQKESKSPVLLKEKTEKTPNSEKWTEPKKTKDLPKSNFLLPPLKKSGVKEPSAVFFTQETLPPVSIALKEPVQKKLSEELPEKTPFFHHYKITGQIFQTYWIIEQNKSIFIVDQHAAHERILFEELMNRFQKESVVAQRLVQPVVIHLTLREKEILKTNREILEKFGFELEEFGQQDYAICPVPFLFQNPSDISYFTEMIDLLGKNPVGNLYDTKIHAIATMACKAAVKAHDKLDFQEAKSLIDQLLLLENPFTCPHGRPTIIEMTKYELEKKFKRIL